MSVSFFDLKETHAEVAAELDAAWARVRDSHHYVLGPELEAFEAGFAEYCGAAHCVGVGNGLEALALTLRAMGIAEGDEVIVPSHTFVATWLAVQQVGARPVPVEPDLATYNLDVTQVEKAITARTRAIIPVHLYGQPSEMTAIRALAQRHGIKVLEDAAQAHGARWKGARAGSLGDAAAFSFYPTKNLGALGDGGAVVTSDESLARELRKLRNYGSVRKYEHELPGVNSRLDPLQAALLAAKLPKLDGWNERRRRIAAAYGDGLAGIEGLSLPQVAPGAEPVWHLYVIRTPRRALLQERLTAEGIHTLIHYPKPPHLQGSSRGLGFGPGDFPRAEKLAEEVLSLPMWPHLGEPECRHVIEVVRRVMRS